MKKLEYGEILRSQMSSAQHDRPRRDQPQHVQNIVEKIGSDYENQKNKINKDEYRNVLEKQIEEKKLKQLWEKRQFEQEELEFQEKAKLVQPSYFAGNSVESYEPKVAYPTIPETNRYARQSTITSQSSETQESVSKKLQYQAELRAQIEEKERLAKFEKQKEREIEEFEERK